MSQNKSKYFEVTVTSIVRANNQSDALDLVDGIKGTYGEVLSQEYEIARMTAAEARTLSAAE